MVAPASKRWIFLVLALGLLGYAGWRSWRESSVQVPAAGSEETAPARPTEGEDPAPQLAATAPRAPAPVAILPGGFDGRDAAASLSPAERESLRQAEARNAASAAAPTAYVGIDGKSKAFRYNDPGQAAAERQREDRRRALARELAADPARFARVHQLSAKEVRWILDGETDFPDRLLEP